MFNCIKVITINCIRRARKLIYYFNLMKKTNRLFLFNTPIHGNLGDHAIVEGEYRFFEKYFSKYNIIEINGEEFDTDLNYIKLFIKKKDIIFVHGGGYLGTLWINEENRFRKILKTFNHNKIIVFPQTVYFSDDEYGKKELKKSKYLYSLHNNLYVFLRDMNSYNFYKENINTKNIYYFPDMVTFIEPNLEYESNNRVLLCMRNDKEKSLKVNLKDKILEYLKSKNENIVYTDTVINQCINKNERNHILYSFLVNYGSSKLVITDRLHGMVFAAITGTPCIAFDNVSKKVSGVYKWLESLEYIRTVNSYEEFAIIYIDFVKNEMNKKVYCNPNEDKFKEMANVIYKVIC